MKLAEIINSSHIFVELPADEVQQKLEMLSHAKKILELNKFTELCQLGDIYCIRRHQEIIGWLDLGRDVTIVNRAYHTIKFIYFVPHARKTRAVGLFLLGLKKVLQYPLILGSDEFGGVLFSGGMELVRALGDSKHFTVSTLNMNTGEIIPLQSTDPLNTKKHGTLVFEGSFPLYHDAGIAGRIYLFQD